MENGAKQDPDKVIFNFSKLPLTDAEKSLFVKGLSLAVTPKQLNYSGYLINFELFYRRIDNLKIMIWWYLRFYKN